MDDIIKRPAHYTQYGVEVIEITRHLPFCLGNVVKYVLRAPYKNGREDIEKALQYLEWCDDKPIDVPQECLDAMDKMADTIPSNPRGRSIECYPGDATKTFLVNLHGFITGKVSRSIMEHVVRYVGDAIEWKISEGKPQRRVYLAAPYSDPDSQVRKMRFSRVTEVAAELMNRGLAVFSPVTMGHIVSPRSPAHRDICERLYDPW